MNKTVIIGAGGHARVVLDALMNSEAPPEIVGFIDLPGRVGAKVDGYEVIGTERDLPGLIDTGVSHAIVGLGSLGESKNRKRIYNLLKDLGFSITNALHRRSVISGNAWLGQGIAVMAGAIINTGAKIGNNSIVNTGAIIEHDCVIGDHAHIAPGATLSGGVKIGEGAHIGTNATIIQGVSVGSSAVIGAGAVVIRDVGIGDTIIGNPGRVILRPAGL